MRRIIQATAVAAIALTTALPAVAVAGSDPHTDRITDRVTDRVTDVEVIRLDCRVRTTDAGQVVRCEWSEPQARAAAGIKLYRLDPAIDDHRRLIYRSGDLAQTTFTDSHVRQGHKYAYGVVVVDANGRVVGRSRAEWVRVPVINDVELLRLDCELGPQREAVGCEWSRPQTRDAYVVSLWRSVNGGERELVERFRPTGPNAYRDPVPAGATHITYAVIATSETDRIVARSRPDTVRIPTVDVEPAGPIAVELVAP